MSRYPKNSNPFEDDDEIDDFTFVNKPNSSAGSGKTGYGRREEDYGSRQRQLWDEASASEDRQMDSTRRALASIHQSEEIGIATAEELVRQGEVLDNIETKTGGINQNLKSTQKHLNSIKSVFGGFKNWWNGTDSTGPKEPVESTRKLKQTVEREKEYTAQSSSLTGSKLRSGDVSGFYDTENDLDSKFLAGSRHGNERMFEPVTNSAREQEIDENLGLMSSGMARLKVLAMDMGGEIDSQNEQLDRIDRKVVIADSNIQNQNKQMRKILK
ncbi:hypothetical protein LOTGIDRAFT_237114 [Lottia gigantea]|uniref:t-SNARE coiled-coil homology domain-containing protein n=1 Tax=Lottia gigantea TaxID=225164 RepID=V3ZIQ7_LOTGI|nr:hypothetical protein LOTGIDRAFT_237114 [Lottia gigantea]ESO82215.1 hypothetical protein LOTGIDRAFT_237114 [Lottia gigantea]